MWATNVDCVRTEGMFGEDLEAKAEFERLAEQERQLWLTIITGAGVKEHMEDTYCYRLRVCSLFISVCQDIT